MTLVLETGALVRREDKRRWAWMIKTGICAILGNIVSSSDASGEETEATILFRKQGL